MNSPPATTVKIVLTSVSSQEEAGRIARHLVESRIAACVKLVPGIQSVYRWEGAIEAASEIMLLIKTSADHVAAVEFAIAEIHSYAVPEFLVISVESGSPSYLEWLAASLL